MGIFDVVTGQRNYTERDVQEIARAFTGWKFSFPDEDDKDPFNYRYFLNEEEHDAGLKTIFGQTANFSGEDVIEVLAARRETAHFLVKKFFEFFVYPLSDSNADKATIDKFANVYINRNHSIRELARSIFKSDEFFSPRARFALVKQPVEFVVGAVRMLGARYNQGTWKEDKSSNILADAATFLGQDLLNPPDVSGWNLNLGWINTAFMLNRFTFADYLALSRSEHESEPGVWLSHSQLKKSSKKNARKTARKFLSLLSPLEVDTATENSLITYLETDHDGNRVEFKRTNDQVDEKVRGLVHLIMCLAEFQVN